MNPDHGVDPKQYIERLRTEFDASFAVPALASESSHEQLLAVAVGEQPHLLRVSQLAGIHADKVVTPVPSSSPHLVGVSALRGNVMAVFDLASLLGHPRAASHRWVVQVRDDVIGLTFATFLGYVRVSSHTLRASGELSSDGAAVAVQIDGTSYALVEVPQVIGLIRNTVSTVQEI